MDTAKFYDIRGKTVLENLSAGSSLVSINPHLAAPYELMYSLILDSAGF